MTEGGVRALPPRRGLRVAVFLAATVGAYFGLRRLGLSGWLATLLGLVCGLSTKHLFVVLIERSDRVGPHGP